jgi:hypothetical protein
MPPKARYNGLKKTALTLLGEKEKTHNKNAIGCGQKDKDDYLHSSGKG